MIFPLHMKKLPELLCPAGSPEALDAAIEGGADAVYLGGASFNARMNATNFGGDTMRSAVLRAHAFGVKVYLTLNTLVTDRELPAFVDAAREAAKAGVDALIVADAGGAAAIRRTLPTIELHASTQMSGHCSNIGKELQRMGFTRMVIARETPAEDIRRTVQNSPIEVEMFVHGALCVSHSGQCLFSSLVGGRSGNRGECAQPCRLPFACKKNANSYPLSLKDLSLAAHVPELIDMGVASLKIEGRMKSPEYVRDTARIWRRLLDENRAATKEEMKALADIFSRNGFTNAYYTERIGRSMLGVRSEADKSSSRTQASFEGLTRRVPLTLKVCMKTDAPIALTLSDGVRSVTICGEIPQPAINAPLTKEALERSLSKFGGTVYAVQAFRAEIDDGLMLPVSRLNDLRRRALQAFEEGKAKPSEDFEAAYISENPLRTRQARRTARFLQAEQITEEARRYFDRIYLPLHNYAPVANGVVLPPVLFDREIPLAERMLRKATEKGATHALVGNYGHLSLVRRAGLIPVGDYRLNVTNRESVRRAEEFGIEEMILSPELTLPQIRDVGGNTSVIVYGRVPLMTLEKCVIREIADCDTCAKGTAHLRDRRGVEFPVLREWDHRNVIYNSLPTCMSDRKEQLREAKITAWHFLFSVETPSEVDAAIEAYRHGSALRNTVRRI